MRWAVRFVRQLQLGILSTLLLLAAGGPNCSFFTSPDGANGPATIHLERVQQIIRGFGAANIVGWRPDMTPSEIQTAFGVDSGQLGFTIMRLRIPPDSTQFRNNVPSAKSAASMGVTIIATPWTPPAWMKTNKSLVGGRLDTTAYAAFASHLKAFADTMSAGGAPLYAISVQNEPDANVDYESCFWNGTEFLNFMKHNATSVGVPVFMPESKDFNRSLSDPALNDPAAAASIAFIGGHIYGTNPTSYPLAINEGKEVWMTEYLTLGTAWNDALGTAKSINDCMNAQMSAYIWWYIVRYYGPIGENGSVTKRGYVMSQFARFVRPGYYRVDIDSNPQQNVFLTSYKNGSRVVIVALNMGLKSIDQEIVIPNAGIESFTPYVSSSSENCDRRNDIPFSNGRFTAALEPSSVTTFVSN